MMKGKLKSFFKKTVSESASEQQAEGVSPSVPEGLWTKCPRCGDLLYKEDVVRNHYVCPKCGGYFRMKAKTRIRMVVDPGSFTKLFSDLQTSDPLEYPGYIEKVNHLREKTHLDEAVRIGKATIDGIPVMIGACDTRFLMASMGTVVGEKITRAFELATQEKLPVILFCCSGGARMQEGISSLMQMAKTAAAIQKHNKAGLLYIPVLTDPTTGGVTASFAMLGDLILAEPGALIGFAGPRVIAQTIRQKLPEGFQRAEFLKEHGFVDQVVPREELQTVLKELLRMHQKKVYCSKEKTDLQDCETEKVIKEEEKNQSAWERVQIARSSERPVSLDYIQRIFSGFMELHGDRVYGDDGAVVGGIAWLDQRPVTVIGVQKGRTTKENIHRNFGMPSPEGYRKALRLMKQAEKFNRPVICFVDTPGAFCGLEAEERGQGEAIARNLMEMSDLRVPVLSIVIGEGGSGGALALAVANEVWMMENATYSILSPEGFASILWKDSKRAQEAAEVMKITARDLEQLSVIEKIIPEEEPAGEENLEQLSGIIKREMTDFLKRMDLLTPEELQMQRYERFRRM